MASGSQTQFWNTFTNLKRDSIYIETYRQKVERIDRGLTIFGAISSSSAIAGWLIWKELSVLWAIVIALGQLYTVVKPSLPYASRLQSLIKLGSPLDALALAAEAKWYAVAHGLLTDQEIYDLTMSLKMDCQQAQDRAFDGTSLPFDDDLFRQAEKEALDYMASMAGI